MNRRGAAFWVVLAIALVVVGFLSSGRRNETGQPLDPESTDALGTRALIELIESFGADVTFGAPDDTTDTTLLLQDVLQPAQEDDLDRWIDDGGTLVVTDPSSFFAASTTFPPVTVEDALGAEQCTIAGLSDLALEGGTYLLYDTVDADGSCFGPTGEGYVHIRRQGEGRVISLGGGVPLSNQYLDEGDNAVLGAEVLLGSGVLDDAPRGAAVAVLYDPILTAGERELTDLIPAAARSTGWQLLVAFAVFAFWRARRFGRPVDESQPVKLPGSLLVRATGELQRRSGGYATADERLRHDLEQRVRRHLKTPPDLTLAELLPVVIDASGLPAATVSRSFDPTPAADRVALVGRLRAVDEVAQALDLAAEPALQGEPT